MAGDLVKTWTIPKLDSILANQQSNAAALAQIQAQLASYGPKVDQLLSLVRLSLQNEGAIMADLSALDAAVASAEAAVSANTDVVGSASALLDQLAELIRSNATDPAALQALADRISSASSVEESNNAALAAAVAANTPVA